MRVVLKAVEGPLAGRQIAFRSPIIVTLGRTERADYVLEGDPEISSVHLQLDCADDFLELRDLNSSNGTQVNDATVSQVRLRDGDTVRIGQSILFVSIQGAASPREESLQRESRSPRETATKASAETARDRKSEDSTSRLSEMLAPDSPSLDSQPPDRPVTDSSAPDSLMPQGVPVDPSPSPKAPSSAPPVPKLGHSGVPSVVLQIESVTDRGRTIWIRAGQHLTLGRNEQADIALAHDNQLSALHFSIKFDGQICEIRDLDSQNGLSVNGAAVQVAQLSVGDTIIAGQTTFRVTGGQTSTPVTAGQTQGVAPRSSTSPELASVPAEKWPPYRAGLSSDDSRVRRTAMLAAMWQRQTWFLNYCQSASNRSPVDWQAVYFWAVLATGDQVDRLMKFLNSSNAAERFNVLGALGHPDGVPMIIEGISDPDIRQAWAAGRAFTKITGVPIDSPNRVPLPAESPADEDDEFAEVVCVPDIEAAKQHWQAHESRFRSGRRWCRGVDVSNSAPADSLDMQSRSEALLREHFLGLRVVNPTELDRFPSR